MRVSMILTENRIPSFRIMLEWDRLLSEDGIARPPDRARARARPTPVGDRACDRARHSAASAVAPGFSRISELPLPSGRRADLVALNERGRNLDR